MKIEIFGVEPEADVLRLKLVPDLCGKGSVSLVAVQANGERMGGGMILSITAFGITVHSKVDPKVGLPRSTDGCVVTKKEGE